MVLDTRVTHNFIDEQETEHLGLRIVKKGSIIKAINSTVELVISMQKPCSWKLVIGKVH